MYDMQFREKKAWIWRITESKRFSLEYNRLSATLSLTIKWMVNSNAKLGLSPADIQMNHLHQ